MTIAINHVKGKEFELVVQNTTIKSGVYSIQLASGDASLSTNLIIEDEPAKQYKTFYFDKLSIGGLSKSPSYSNGGLSKPVVNTNTSGKPISVLIDGESREFTKGYSTLGNSKIVLDARFGDKKTYTRAVGRLGIDSSQIGQGNGVDVKVYQGNPGAVKLAHEFKNVTADKNAIYLDLDLAKDGYYLEFHVSNKGNDAGDMFVLADFKLVETDYQEPVSNVKIEGLKRVADYDAILSKNKPEVNLAQNKMLILQREFVNKVGYQTVKAIAETSPEHAEAIEFLMNNEVALENLITGGPASKEGSYTNAIRHFCSLYAAHGEDFENPADNYFNLRLAISTALVYANPILATSWYGSSYNTDPVVRYELYQRLVDEGYMDRGGDTTGFNKWSTKQFKELPVPLMRWVVGNRINNDEILWLADYALATKAKTNAYLDATYYVGYLDYNYANPEMYDLANKDKFNDKYNFEKYFPNYGAKDLVRLWMVFKEGAVCGGISKTYHNLATTFGRPSSVMGQPGHAAAMTYGWNNTNQRYEWQIQYNIYGWAQSGNEYNDRLLNWGNKPWAIWHSASYNILATDAVLQGENFKEATLLNFLANSYGDKDKEAIFEKALDVQPINLESMEGLINAYKADTSKTSQDYLNLAKRIIDTYTYYPQVMMEMLPLIEDGITDSSHLVQLDFLKNNALTKASVATAKESTNVQATKDLANKYLNNGNYGPVATFSFDGDNAGKIVMNERYNDSQITLEYSLDGGTTWTETNKHVISLTDEQIKSITAENDIKVRLMGVDTVHTIDILEGVSSKDKVQANDFENLLLGNTSNLEYSLDGGETWSDYVTLGEDTINPKGLTGIRFDGDKEVEVRYKANAQYLQGESVKFTFTANADTETAKYVQQRHVKVKSASAHQNGQDPTLVVDGNLNSGFHTKYNVKTEDKHIIFEFDEARYITALDYVFIGGNNGRMKDGEILASMDGQTWEVIKTFSNMPRGVNEQKYEMDKVVKAKFIKLAPTQTHGNSTGETNMYFAAKEVRFYEDTLKEAQPQSPIEIVDELPEVSAPSTNNGPQSPIEYTDIAPTAPTPSTNNSVQSPVYIESPIQYN